MPELTRNPIFTAVRIAEAIDQLQKKELDKRQAVLSVSSIQAGHASNVVPDEAVIEGTSRFFNVDDGAFIEKAFKEIIAAEDGRDDIKVVLDYEVPYSLPLVNSDNAFQHIKATATGLGDFYELDEPVKTAEDFAFYLNACGGAMFWLGLGEDWPKLHTATFNFNEEALVKGISMFCHLALSYK